MSSLHDLTALQQADAIRKGELDAVELVEHYLARIARLNDTVGAFVTVTAAAALRQAREADGAVTRGAELPPLHGVPTAIKDLARTAGVRTTFGSAAYQDFVPTVDDHVVTLLRRAGTISLGKTNTPEFGLTGYTAPMVAPPARTPWDLTRSAGGSSGGSAAAVAAGLVPFAHGSDGGGSVRIPASVCGLVGIKVSRGRISRGPLRGDTTGLSWDGPIARTVRDAAALLDAMAVPMPGDPHWAQPLPPSETFLGWADRDPGRLRVARFIRPVSADVPVDPDCVAAWEDASQTIASLGHDVEDIAPPFGPEITPCFETLWSVSAAAIPLDPQQVRKVTPLTRWLRERGAAASAVQFVTAVDTLQLATRAWLVASASYDAVLAPTLAQAPRPIGWFAPEDPAADFERVIAFTPFTMAFNITGQPAINLPLHWNRAGLPIGVMLVGRPAGEAALISLSAQLEAARPWKSRRPDCWSD